MVLGAGCPGRQAAGGATYTGRRSPTGKGCVGEGDGECERLAERGPSAAAGGSHKISKKKVYIICHALVRMLLPCFYATPWGLRLDIFKTDFLAW